MQRVTLGQFIQRTTLYERTPININPGLRRGVWINWLLVCVIGAFYYFLPSGNYLRWAPFFWWTKGWLANSWDFVADNRYIFVTTCGFVFCIILWLLLTTQAFHRAEIGLHVVLFIPVVFVAINLLFILVLLLPVIANLIVWLCLLTIICILVATIIVSRFSREHSQ